jgi:hypothetical protein
MQGGELHKKHRVYLDYVTVDQSRKIAKVAQYIPARFW